MFRSVRMISDNEDNNYKLLPAGFPVTGSSPSSSQTYYVWNVREVLVTVQYSTCCLQNLHWIGTEVGLATTVLLVGLASRLLHTPRPALDPAVHTRTRDWSRVF